MTNPPNQVPPNDNQPMDLPENLADVIQELRERIQEHEAAARSYLQIIIMQRHHNRILQRRLRELRNLPPDDSSTGSSESSENQ